MHLRERWTHAWLLVDGVGTRALAARDDGQGQASGDEAGEDVLAEQADEGELPADQDLDELELLLQAPEEGVVVEEVGGQVPEHGQAQAFVAGQVGHEVRVGGEAVGLLGRQVGVDAPGAGAEVGIVSVGVELGDGLAGVGRVDGGADAERAERQHNLGQALARCGGLGEEGRPLGDVGRHSMHVKEEREEKKKPEREKTRESKKRRAKKEASAEKPAPQIKKAPGSAPALELILGQSDCLEATFPPRLVSLFLFFVVHRVTLDWRGHILP